LLCFEEESAVSKVLPELRRHGDGPGPSPRFKALLKCVGHIEEREALGRKA